MTAVMANYKNSGFFVLRTPLLPLEGFRKLSEQVQAKEHDAGPDLDAQLREERGRVRAQMARMIALPEVWEAIFLASPSLHDQINAWLENPASEAAMAAEHALFRYLARMSTRPTPFGLFAGVSIGELQAKTHLFLKERENYTRYTRLDNDYLYLLLQELNHSAELRNKAMYFPNTSLYRNAGAFRYVEASTDEASRAKQYRLVSVDASEYLEFILRRAEEGATREQLAAAIAQYDDEVSLEEADDYIDLLIENQLLVSTLELSVTGREPLDAAIEELRDTVQPVLVDKLLELREELRALDRRHLGNPRGAYEGIAQRLHELPVGEVKLSRLFQVNMSKPLAANALGREVVVELRAALEALYRIAAPPGDDVIEDFKRRFAEKYEGRSVPLSEALDEETGIGMEEKSINAESSPLLEGLDFDVDSSDQAKVRWGAREQWLLERVTKAWETGEQEITLADKELRRLEVKGKPPLPDAFATTFHLEMDPGSRAEGDWPTIVLDGAAGPSGATLLGRFCHESKELSEWVQRHIAEEEAAQPEAVFAEIAHLPEGRIGNVICRPLFREYEIPYLGKSGADRTKQLPLTDLMLSLVGGRLVLTSKRLRREIIPRLSNAHNIFTNCLGVYKFLAHLQHQDCTWRLGWDWGPLADAPRLPRVRIRSVVVARAQWTVKGTDLAEIGNVKNGKRFRKMSQLRERLGMPRWVALADGDNTLAVDLESMVNIDAMIEIVKKRPAARFIELWPGHGQAVVRGPEGSFANEIVVPFVKKRKPSEQPTHRPKLQGGFQRTEVQRVFPLGSEWLYIKFYASESVIPEFK